MCEPFTFDWQAGGTNDTSWRGKSRQWIEDKPGCTRALVRNKVLAVFIPTEGCECVSAACSAESEGSTTDSPAPGGSTPSCASPTSGGEGCCGSGSPASPSTTTYETWPQDVAGAMTGGNTPHGPRSAAERLDAQTPLIFSLADRPARISASPAAVPDLTEPDPDCSSKCAGSLSLFDPDGFSGRTYRVRSLHRAVGTSEQCLERWPTSGTAWHGGFSTAVSSECRSVDGVCSSSEPSLTEILEPPQSVPERYSLSARAARGILRRAEKRGRTLPGHLAAALESVAGLRTPNE